MSIQLVTYANQTVTPTNDAIIYERAIDQNGIFYGCNVTVSSNNVNITGGYGIVCGREFVIQSESVAVTLAPSGTLQGRLYVRLDLADADAPIQLLTATGNTLPPLEQDADVNYTNGAYEMELATFTVGVSSLSDVVETFETIVGSKLGQRVDYITEQGTSGIWTYRKWASGIAECWGTKSQTLSGSSAVAPFSGYCYAFGGITFPTSLFNATPTVNVNGKRESNYVVVSFCSPSSTGVSVELQSSIGGSASCSAYIHAVGTWK